MTTMSSVKQATSTSAVAWAGAIALALALSACGSAEDPTAADVTDAATSAVTDAQAAAEDAATDAEDMVEEMKEDLEGQQAAQGGGSASLTVGGQTWDFDRVLCAFGEEETGQEGAEFVLSSIQDGMQFYVSIDSFGHSVTLDDIENFADPSVSLDSSLATNADSFIQVSGKQVSGEMSVWDDLAGEEKDAAFEGTCP